MHFLGRVGVRIVNNYRNKIASSTYYCFLCEKKKEQGINIYDFILIYYTALVASRVKLAL